MKGVPMSRNLLAVTLCAFTASAYSMTASVTPSAQQAGSPTAPAISATTSAVPDTRPGAAPTKQAVPSAASATSPAAVLSAPGVPTKSNAVAGAKTGVAPSKANTFMPSAANQTGAAAPAPANAAWAATARGSSAMRRGTLEAINVNAGTLQVYGQKLSFNTQGVKVFNRDGRPGSIFTVKSGASVRFTMDAADPAQRRVAVIYVD
jgi:hypothetical protein